MLGKLRILTLVTVLALAGCSTTNDLLTPENLYPKALTSCADFNPEAPRTDASKPRSDHDKADLVQDLYGSYLDCKTVVSGWSERRDLYVKQYESNNYGFFSRIWRGVTGASGND